MATLNRYIDLPDGGMTCQKLKQEKFEGEFTTEIEDRADIGLVHVNAFLKQKSDIQRIENLLDIVHYRGTQKFFEGEGNDYALVIELMNDDEKHRKLYILSFIQPLFISNEGEVFDSHTFLYKMTFNKVDTNFGIQDYSLDEVEYELMNDFDRNEYATEELNTNKQFDENDDIVNNDDIIGV